MDTSRVEGCFCSGDVPGLPGTNQPCCERRLTPVRGACFAPEELLAQFAKPCGFLLLALHAGLFVVFAAAGFRKDAVLLDTLVEALQRYFKRFVISNDNLSQCRITSPSCQSTAEIAAGVLQVYIATS